jgi:23S rRNA (guanine2445-N2)-methyltransferase / 23S rRNA (guanine2069-N7)-methyltransferase
MPQTFFATVASGLEELLAEELASLGAISSTNTRGGVHFEADFKSVYRICLWSRLAGRILFPLHHFGAADEQALYSAAGSIDWSEHLTVEQSFAVDCTARQAAINHTQFAALRVKDAIVDQFRERTGNRPNIEVQQPGLQLHLYLEGEQGTLYLDLSGESLHRRGYRTEGARAPLKETLAAAILYRCKWPELAARGLPFVDPMCGSGTLVLEAALIAGDIAPGFFRDYYGFFGWKQFDAQIWQELLDEASARRNRGLASIPQLFGYDQDGRSLKAARDNAERAGVADRVNFQQRALKDLTNPLTGNEAVEGLLVVNPPYGERIGELESLAPLYRTLGESWSRHFPGWQAALLTSEKMLAFQVGYRAQKKHAFMNGPIACQLYHFRVAPEFAMSSGRHATLVSPAALEQAAMFANRLKKNLKRLRPWLKKNAVDCYRVYDRDLPEYAVAVDCYAGAVHVQEYRAPALIDENKAKERLQAALEVIPEALSVSKDQVFCKVRERQKGANQYRRQENSGEYLQVSEGGLQFLVNLRDYLDTGLFLDHRITRSLLRELAAGKRFLNLFCYTATATVYAASGGATATTSVDLSRTYLDWAKSNFALNDLSGKKHQLVMSDCTEWLRTDPGEYDLIFIDPPTFSNSKRMSGVFDVQRDHVELLQLALQRLSNTGQIVFSTNFRQFKLEQECLTGIRCSDWSARTLPEDFARNPKIHQCWLLERANP